MIKCDLHIHSVYSDGIHTPEEIAEAAGTESLSCIAVADHDTLDGLAAAEYSCKKKGIRLIPAVLFLMFLFVVIVAAVAGARPGGRAENGSRAGSLGKETGAASRDSKKRCSAICAMIIAQTRKYPPKK